jgi:proteasome lid subunit RPN8/RPN11
MMSDASPESPVADEPAQPLEIPADILEDITAHCRRESPLECCGILGGVWPRVMAVHPLRNIAASETRYEADPHQLVEAWRQLRERGWEILTIYHSHPRWRAVPSATDRQRNYWGAMPHIIVSLLTDPPEVRIWRLYETTQRELLWLQVEPAQAVARPLQVRPAAD